MQIHKDEIIALPEFLAGKMDLLPELLLKSRATSTSGKYENNSIRWKKWALTNGLGRGDISPANKALNVEIHLCPLVLRTECLKDMGGG